MADTHAPPAAARCAVDAGCSDPSQRSERNAAAQAADAAAGANIEAAADQVITLPTTSIESRLAQLARYSKQQQKPMIIALGAQSSKQDDGQAGEDDTNGYASDLDDGEEQEDSAAPALTKLTFTFPTEQGIPEHAHRAASRSKGTSSAGNRPELAQQLDDLEPIYPAVSHIHHTAPSRHKLNKHAAPELVFTLNFERGASVAVTLVTDNELQRRRAIGQVSVVDELSVGWRSGSAGAAERDMRMEAKGLAPVHAFVDVALGWDRAPPVPAAALGGVAPQTGTSSSSSSVSDAERPTWTAEQASEVLQSEVDQEHAAQFSTQLDDWLEGCSDEAAGTAVQAVVHAAAQVPGLRLRGAALRDAALSIPPTALQLHVTPEAEAAQRSALLQSKSSSSRSARSSSISSDEVLRGIAQQLHAALSASSMQLYGTCELMIDADDVPRKRKVTSKTGPAIELLEVVVRPLTAEEKKAAAAEVKALAECTVHSGSEVCALHTLLLHSSSRDSSSSDSSTI
jgi:hypothetical protein